MVFVLLVAVALAIEMVVANMVMMMMLVMTITMTVVMKDGDNGGSVVVGQPLTPQFGTCSLCFLDRGEGGHQRAVRLASWSLAHRP